MKTIGILGGMSWESTQTYYKVLNELVRDRLGGLHSAQIVLLSLDFEEIERCQSSGNWARAAEILAEAARGLEAAGANVILIATNTMHKVAPEVARAVTVPLLHIAEATGAALARRGIRKVGLLGTKYTMTEPFYKCRLEAQNFDVLVPAPDDINLVNRVIFDELCLGTIRPESKVEFLRIIDDLRRRGAEGVILGCTEIGLLVTQEDTDLPVFDTTLIHAEEAVRFALGEPSDATNETKDTNDTNAEKA